jgi:hypothetical protein
MSPVYLAVSTHWPSVCFSGDRCFPFHTWDTTCGFQTWEYAGMPTAPSADDRAFGASVREVWRGLAFDGQLPATMPPVNSSKGFPASYTTLTVDTTVQAVSNFKTQACQRLQELGLGKQFWWVN